MWQPACSSATEGLVAHRAALPAVIRLTCHVKLWDEWAHLRVWRDCSLQTNPTFLRDAHHYATNQASTIALERL
jgi:hypothetical protein